MEIMEAIRISIGGQYGSQGENELIDRLEKELSGVKSLDWHIYHNATVSGDILIELNWTAQHGEPRESEIALALISELKHIGLVSHTLWLKS